MSPIAHEADYEKAKALIVQSQNSSVAFLQRNLKLPYSVALGLIDLLESKGVVTPPDEQGYRRLTPAFEKTPTDVFNNWRIFPNAKEASFEGELLNVSAAVAAVRPYSPTQVAFHRESGLPWIELTFSDAITPQAVISIGLELEHVLQFPVYMGNLQLRKVEYVVEGNFLLPAGDSYVEDHFKSMRLPMRELAQTWGVQI